MDDQAWSFSIGRWFGVRVCAHMLVVLFALVSTYAAWKLADQFSGISPFSLALAVGIGWGIALVCHEVGHLFVASHLGTEVRGLTLMPWGSRLDTPEPRGWNQLMVHLGGPLANIFVAALGSVAAIAIFDARLTVGFFHPLSPERILEGQSLAENALRIIVWSNWVLALINFVPAYLFDGGPIMASSVQMIWPRASERQVAGQCSLITQLFAVMTIAMAVVIKASGTSEVIPSWFGLLLFGFVLMFASRVHRPTADSRLRIRTNTSLRPYKVDYSNFDEVTSLEFDAAAYMDRDPAGQLEDREIESEESLSVWLKERQVERVELVRQRELEEEQQADAILEKVHSQGLDSLSSEDRDLLERVSRRLRNRQSEQA